MEDWFVVSVSLVCFVEFSPQDEVMIAEAAIANQFLNLIVDILMFTNAPLYGKLTGMHIKLLCHYSGSVEIF